MSRLSYVIVTLIVVGASVAILGWSFFGLGGSKPLSPNTAQPTTAPSKKAQSPVITDCTPPEVNKSRIAFFNEPNNVYGLRATIVSISDVSLGKKLVTDLQGKIPNFVVRPTTDIILNDHGNESAGSLSDVQVGKKVVISIHCSATKSWATSAVRIIEEKP